VSAFSLFNTKTAPQASADPKHLYIFTACAIIDYVLTGGQNLDSGSGLPNVKFPPHSSS